MKKLLFTLIVGIFCISNAYAQCTDIIAMQGPWNDFNNAGIPCDGDPPVTMPFLAWDNESYLLSGLLATSNFIYDYCTGYNAAVWEGNITVAAWDAGTGTVGSVVTFCTACCTIDFTIPTDGDYIVIISTAPCGGASTNTDNGTPTLSVGPGGVPCAPPVAGEDCATAIAITSITTLGGVCTPTTADIATVTDAGTITGSCWFDGPTANNTMWFEFTTPATFTAGTNSLEVSVDGGVGGDPQIAIFTGTCAGLTQIACNDDIDTSNFNSLLNFTASPSTTYYLLVDGWSNGTTTWTGLVDICISESAATPPVCPIVFDGASASAPLYCSRQNVIFNFIGSYDLTAGPTNVFAIMAHANVAGGFFDFAQAPAGPFATADMYIYDYDADQDLVITIPDGFIWPSCAPITIYFYGVALDTLADGTFNFLPSPCIATEWYEIAVTIAPDQPMVLESAGDCATGATLTIGYDTDGNGTFDPSAGDEVCDTSQVSAIPTPVCGTGDATETTAGYTAADLATLLSSDAMCYADIVPTLSASCPNFPIPAATTVTVTDNDCATGTLGTFTFGTCTTGSLEYSTDSGMTWVATAPSYDPVTPVSVMVRCNDSTCASVPSAEVTSAPTECFVCIADAGTITIDTPACLPTGDTTTVSGTASITTAPDSSYSLIYILTNNDADPLILQVSGTAPSFDVTATGTYMVHTFVGLTTDIATCAATVVPGTTTAGTFMACLPPGACYELASSGTADVVACCVPSTATVDNGTICQNVATTLDLSTLVTGGDMAGTWAIADDGGTGATLAGAILTSGTAGTVLLTYTPTGACPVVNNVSVGVIADCTACSPDNGTWD